MAKRPWSVEFHPACEAWADGLAQADAEALLAAIRVLRDEGPKLGRPLVDRIEGSRHANMKELRPGSTGRTEVRVLFAFDTRRRAILLVGGDKSKNWRGWYKVNIRVADDRFDEHQARIARSEARKAQAGRVTERKEDAMTLKRWEKKVLEAPGATRRVAEIEEELRLAAGLTALREEAGLSQRELANRMGISQPRVVAIERARNVTIDVLEQYINAVGGTLEVNAVKGRSRIPLVAPMRTGVRPSRAKSKKDMRARRLIDSGERAAG